MTTTASEPRAAERAAHSPARPTSRHESPEVVLGPWALAQYLGAKAISHVSGTHIVWALLIAATIPWRKGVYFEGGLDTVVLAKAALSLIALGVAIHLSQHARGFAAVPIAPPLTILTYVAVTIIGGFAHGTFMAAAIVGVRIAILCCAITLLMLRYEAYFVLRSLVHVLGILAISAAVSGLAMGTTERLGGVIPPMNPNELAFMATMCFLWLFSKMLQCWESPRDLVLAAVFLGIVVMTGSRASLAAVCVAIIVMGLRATAISRRSFVILTLVGPGMAAVLFGTDIMSSVFLRGGERGITTLANRTIAWDAAFTTNRDPWETWFGAGLAQKRIEVPGQWWTTQLLDSSWVSALIQGGLIGTAIVISFTLATLIRALVAPRAAGAIWLGIIVYVAARGVLESGLFDSTTAFMALMVTALASRLPWHLQEPPGKGNGRHAQPSRDSPLSTASTWDR